jgi:hypothetical protein
MRWPSSPRKRGSTVRPNAGQTLDWIPDCAGMTELLEVLTVIAVAAAPDDERRYGLGSGG